MGDERDDADPTLREMLREAERIIDHQVRAMEGLDEKTQRALTLGVAALGGGLALGSFSLSQLTRGPDVLFTVVLTGAGMLNLAGVLRLLDAYTGLRQGARLRIGPSVGWIAAKMDTEQWTITDHLRSLIAGLARFEQHNDVVLTRAAGLRRTGLMALMVAIAGYAMAFFYILARTLVS